MKPFTKSLLFSLLACIFIVANSINSKACTFKPAFSGDTAVCSGNTVTYSTPPTPTHYYRWVVKGGTVVSGAGTYSVSVLWPEPGKYSIKLIDSTTGCYDSLRQTVRVGLSNATLQKGKYTLTGANSSVSGKVFTVTSSAFGNDYSSVWNQYQISLNRNFDFTFKTNQNGGADGMVFVIQPTGTNVIDNTSSFLGGTYLGYYDLPAGMADRSVAVEMDIYNGGTAYTNGYDSSASHLSLTKNKDFTPQRKQVDISPALGGGGTHKLRVTWVKDANLFEVYFDGKKTFSWNNDILKNVFKGNPNVYFGFTAATGGVTATQTIETDTLIYGLPSIVSSKDSICSGDSLTLMANAGLAYLWSTGAKTRTIKVTKSGRYTCTVTDSNNCTAIATSDSIVVLTKPTAAFTVSNTCQGRGISLVNNSTPATGLKYLWKFTAGDSSILKSPGFQYNTPGSNTITLSVSNGGCTDKTSQTMTTYNSPLGSIFTKGNPFNGQFNNGDNINPDFVCINDTLTYQIASPKGMSNSDYGTKWIIKSLTFTSPFGTTTKDTATKMPTSSKNALFSFFPKKYADTVFMLKVVLRTLPGNCDSVLQRVMKVRFKPTAKFGFTNACLGSGVIFKDSTTQPGLTGISNWSWSFGDTKGSNTQSPSHAYAAPGTYSVTLTASNDGGCSNSITKTVEQYPLPKPKIGTTTACQNLPTSFFDSSTITKGSVSSWAWNFGDGSKSATQNPTHSYVKSGFYTAKLVAVSSFGCKDSITKQVRIQPRPKASFTYLNACIGLPVYIANTSKDSTSPTTYKWDFGDGNTASGPAPGSHIYAANGTYNAKLTVTSKFGCIDTSVQAITPTPKPTVNFFNSAGCSGTKITYSDSGKNGNKALYTWNFGDGGTDVLKNSVTSHTYAKAGSYKVTLSINSEAGCSDSESKTVVISDYPKSGFNTSDVCIGKSSTFNNTTTISSGTATYVWDFGDGSAVSTAQNPSHTYTKIGSYRVKLAAKSAGGCVDTISKVVSVVPLPAIGKWNTGIHNYTVSFTPGDTTQKTYKWYFGTGDSSSLKKPVYTYPGTPASYLVKLVVTNATGCSSSVSDSVEVGKTGIDLNTKKANSIEIFPNPFEGNTNISYTLTEKCMVNISVFDIQGKLVAKLREGNLEPGLYNDKFDAGKYNAGDGVYMVKMVINGKETYTSRIVNMK